MAALDAWVPPWEAVPAPAGPPVDRATTGGPAADLLAGHPVSCDAVAVLLGHGTAWRQPDRTVRSCRGEVAALLTRYPQTPDAVAALLAVAR